MGPWPGAFPQLGFVCVCFVSFFVTHGSYLGMHVLISLGGGHPLAVPGTGEQVFCLGPLPVLGSELASLLVSLPSAHATRGS